MNPEGVRKWLDGVDQDDLDPLDQWCAPVLQCLPQDSSPRSSSVSGGEKKETYQQYNRERNAEVASVLESIPPTGVLLRNGNIKSTGQNPKVLAHAVKNENHPHSLMPGFPANSELTGQPTHTSIRDLEISAREGNNDSPKRKRLPTFPERGRRVSGALHSIPVIRVEVEEPVAINCQGARVVGGHQQNGVQNLPSMSKTSRRDTTAGERALHRSNAVRKHSNVRAEPKVHPKYPQRG